MDYEQKNGKSIKFLVIAVYILMITVNGLANALPLNGIDTGQISDLYPNLFAPAGVTFSIWGLIYLLLAGYALYQFGFFGGKHSNLAKETFEKVALYFIVSSIANALWIFSWHYLLIPVSMLLMIIILVSLIIIANTLITEQLSTRDKIFVKLPFSIYFGWITVATIANATTLLVSMGWEGFGIADPVWAIIMIIAGLLIAAAVIINNKDIAYGLVIIWAYTGILIKHVTEGGFSGQYPQVIVTVIIGLALLVIINIFVLLKGNMKKIN